MGGFLRRWWRAFFNPWPLAGQIWMVDGVGRVTIEYVQHSFNPSCNRGPCDDFYNGNPNFHVHCVTLSGQKVVWPGSHLVFQGYLWTPRTLAEIVTEDERDKQRASEK